MLPPTRRYSPTCACHHAMWRAPCDYYYDYYDYYDYHHYYD